MAESEVPEDKYRLTISGGGINVERLINGQTLAAVMASVMGADQPVVPASLAGGVSPPLVDDSKVRVSLREFLDEVHAKRKPDQIVAIGHYIMQFEGQVDFSRDEVKSQFSVAREPMPANFSRDFGVAEKKGMIAKVHAREGRYYVTNTGTGAIENKFAKEKAR